MQALVCDYIVIKYEFLPEYLKKNNVEKSLKKNSEEEYWQLELSWILDLYDNGRITLSRRKLILLKYFMLFESVK